MLTKRCYVMLEKMLQTKPDEKEYGYSVRQLARLCKIPTSDALRVAELLESEGYLESRTITAPYTGSFKESFRLTELGQNYKEVRLRQRLDYLADKWVDITACIISIIALIVALLSR